MMSGVATGHSRRRGTVSPSFRFQALAVLVLAVAVIAALPSTAHGFTDYEVTIYTTAERDSPAVDAVLRFVQLVEDRTNGRVEFDFFHGGALGADEEAVEDVLIGVLDMVLVPVPAFVKVYPKVQTLLLPYLFEDEDHLRQVVTGPIARDFLREMERQGIQGLALWHGGFRGLGTADRPVTAPGDVEGLVIGSSPGAVFAETWKGFGAQPAVTPWRSVARRLKDGEIEAQDGTPEMFRRAGLHETQGHYSLIDYSWAGYLLAMNRYSWDELPASIRQIMADAAIEVGRWVWPRWNRFNEAALEDMEKAGVLVERRPDRTGFQEKASALYDQWRGRSWYDAEVVAKIKALVEPKEEETGEASQDQG